MTGCQLEMEMIGGGGSASGTIVKDGVFRVGMGDIQHILEMFVYQLRDMAFCRNRIMTGKYRIGICPYVESRVVVETLLFRGHVFLAQEAGSGFQ